MNRKTLTVAMAMTAIAAFASTDDEAMRRTADNTVVVNSATLCRARGYRAATPVEVHIKDGAVVKVEALANRETPSFFERVKQFLLPLYKGLKIDEALKQAEATDIDGCTGATISTKAVQQNIKAALDYYNENK